MFSDLTQITDSNEKRIIHRRCLAIFLCEKVLGVGIYVLINCNHFIQLLADSSCNDVRALISLNKMNAMSAI
jgi:hypothetical protein